MTTSIADPIVTFEALVRTNWNAANVSTITPTFSTGWWDEKNDTPQMSFTAATDSGPFSESGYSGFMGDGSGPFQRRNGFVLCTSFATRKSSAVNPKQLVWEMAREAMRIVHANVYAVGPALDQVGSGELDRFPDQDTPSMQIAQFPILYTRVEEP